MRWLALATAPTAHQPADTACSQRGRKGVYEKKRKRFEAVDNPWGLTGTQVAVMEALVQAGGSNAEAAAVLCMSPKTVSTHLTRTKEKVGATTILGAYLTFDRWRRAGPHAIV